MMPPKRGKRTRTNLTPRQCQGGHEQETDRSRRVFLADRRDRLREPVSAIIEYSELLLEDAKQQGRADLTSDLMKIHALGRKLYALVDAGLDETAFGTANTERERAAFSSNLRHELRTPLNAIIGYSEMLLEDAAADGADALIPDLEKIRSAGLQFLSCIDEFAGFTPAGPGAVVHNIMKDIPSLDAFLDSPFDNESSWVASITRLIDAVLHPS